MPVCDKCQRFFPNRVVIDGKERNLQRRRFCLACSPFGRHNTCDLTEEAETRRQLRTNIAKYCRDCEMLLTSETTYQIKNGRIKIPFCRRCFNVRVQMRQREIKRKCVEYKGGRCLKCGYDYCMAALDFHHVDSDEKERTIAHIQHRSLERLKPELDKCLLLCANCHRELHAWGGKFQDGTVPESLLNTM